MVPRLHPRAPLSDIGANARFANSRRESSKNRTIGCEASFTSTVQMPSFLIVPGFPDEEDHIARQSCHEKVLLLRLRMK